MPDVVRFNGEKQEGVGFYEDVLKEKEAGARSPRLTDFRSDPPASLPPSITPETEVGGEKRETGSPSCRGSLSLFLLECIVSRQSDDSIS